MALSYVSTDRDQPFLLPPDMRDWLPPGHLVWFVLEVVERIDTMALHASHPNDGAGRRAYDPDMLLALLIYAYCNGLRSSRQIERCCESDLAFRVICANHRPDHTTIARFRQFHTLEVGRLFTDVLMLCARAGLAKVGVVAVDGTKMAANAALGATRSRTDIQAEVAAMLAAAQDLDEAEDRALGERRGDELPEGLGDPRSRKARLEEALRQLDAAEEARRAEAEAARRAWRQRADQAEAEAKRPPGRPPAEEAVAAAEATVAMEDQRAAEGAARAAAAKASGRRPGGRRQGPEGTKGQRRARKTLARAKAKAAERRQQAKEDTANTTDPDSRIMKTDKGWVQGYNAQAAVNEAGIVLAAEVTQDHNDVGQCVPMMAALHRDLEAAGVGGEVDLLLFDAGYFSEDNLIATGPDRLIATGKSRTVRSAPRKTGDPPTGASAIEAMEHRLSTPSGRSIYTLRGQLVEPYFGVIKEDRGFRRFLRRGLANVAAEWKLMATASNLLKLFDLAPTLA